MIKDNDFKIKFDGQQPQVDANVLISSLIHITTIVQEVNRHLNSGKKIELKVKALEKGSFLCHIEIIETTVETLKNIFTKENIEIGTIIISGVVGLMEIKRFLKGKKAKEIKKQGNTTIIINEHNASLNISSDIYNVYETNITIKDALCQNFDVLDNDQAVTGFEITNNKEKTFIRIDKSEFADMSKRSDEMAEGERKLIEAAAVSVVRVSFEENLKWDFYYRGIKISAKITDPSFYELIDVGEAFAKGDVLEVELQINQKFDETVNTFVTKSYQINKIARHLSRNEQQKLNFNPKN